MQHAPAGANRIVGTVRLSHSPIYKTCRHGHSECAVPKSGKCLAYLAPKACVHWLVGW